MSKLCSPKRNEATDEKISDAAQRRQTFLRLGRSPAESAPEILQSFADELQRGIERDDQFVKQQRWPGVTTFAQVAQKTDRHVRRGVADVLARTGAAEVGDFHAGMVNDRIALADAGREVQVFSAERELFIPAATAEENVAREQHGGPHEHFDLPRRFGIEVLPPITAVGAAQEAGPAEQTGAVQQRAGGGTLAVGDLRPAFGVA